MTHDPRSDEELIDAANRGGDEAARAFEALYLRYRDWVVSLAVRFIGNRDLALDVLQETFMYVMRKFPGFVLTAQFKTFLFPVVRNLSIAARKKAARYSNPTDDEGNDMVSTAGEQAGAFGQTHLTLTTEDDASRQMRAELAIVMQQLSDEHRETVMLRFVDGFSMEEIGAAMDVPPGTVKSRLHHALRKLRDDPRVREYFEP